MVTHLECSLTGERYEADRPHGLLAAGRPLLVRYDLAAAATALSRDLAMVDLATSPWRIALPREGQDERAAAVLAGRALALTWEAGTN